MGSTFSSCQTVLSQTIEISSPEQKFPAASDEKAEIKSLEKDVNNLQIKNDEKNEKEISEENGEIIVSMTANIELAEDTTNTKKDFEIKKMKRELEKKEKQLKELSGQRNELQQKLSEMKIMYKKSTQQNTSQEKKLQEFAFELQEVKRELNLSSKENKKWKKSMEIYIQKNQEGVIKEMKATNEATMKEIKEVKEATTKELKEIMTEGIAKIVSTTETKKEPRDLPKDFKIEANHVQIAVDSEKGTNIVQQTPRSRVNRRALKTSEINMRFPK